ncbi:hypothetical protein FOL47_007644 [Perkinsus chesapeaki]|uniref:GMP phosphodiesterase delta subunit domain-containing protein n=1 Tax=Perkinsus chesapeaki TaxID=330153 RepID=A0A7J6MVP4_PERCH|nr:hypothetical protein FOL47_007644 [Perkinsus chesapeaki]
MEPTSADSGLEKAAEPTGQGKAESGVWEWVTPEVVTKFSCATEDFLCPVSANTYGIDFIGFTVRDLDSGITLLEIKKDIPESGGSSSSSSTPDDVPPQRNIRYNFGPEFLELRTVGTNLEFVVGEKPVRNFRMIERHYFKDKILKSYDFTMPFCIPNSVNTWEVRYGLFSRYEGGGLRASEIVFTDVIYELPELTDEEKDELIDNPWETKSDSFYFVDDVLIMHNKADYSYADIID